jgi:hypothetical protein
MKESTHHPLSAIVDHITLLSFLIIRSDYSKREAIGAKNEQAVACATSW